jgi:hypothetical protein
MQGGRTGFPMTRLRSGHTELLPEFLLYSQVLERGEAWTK